MLHLYAGHHPHVITRPCRDRVEAEHWAQTLIERGFGPVFIDGRCYESGGIAVPCADREVQATRETLDGRGPAFSLGPA